MEIIEALALSYLPLKEILNRRKLVEKYCPDVKERFRKEICHKCKKLKTIVTDENLYDVDAMCNVINAVEMICTECMIYSYKCGICDNLLKFIGLFGESYDGENDILLRRENGVVSVIDWDDDYSNCNYKMDDLYYFDTLDNDIYFTGSSGGRSHYWKCDICCIDYDFTDK